MNVTNNSMADIEQQPDPLDEDALRRRLINRIALAGVAIVALLGGLAVIDSMYVAPTATRPKAPAPVMADAAKPLDATTISSVVGQDQAPAAQPAEQAAPEPPKPEAVPTIKGTAEPEESASPSVLSPRQQRPLTKMPEVRQAVVKPEPATASAHAPASRPLAQQAAQAESRFILQMGVFNNLDNAQELLAKLQKHGVPAQIEARVQVGPFKSKAEADAARARLKALGLEAGLLMAVHR